MTNDLPNSPIPPAPTTIPPIQPPIPPTPKPLEPLISSIPPVPPIPPKPVNEPPVIPFMNTEVPKTNVLAENPAIRPPSGAPVIFPGEKNSAGEKGKPGGKNKKVLLSVVGLLILSVALGTGVYFGVLRPQLMQPKATSEAGVWCSSICKNLTNNECVNSDGCETNDGQPIEMWRVHCDQTGSGCSSTEILEQTYTDHMTFKENCGSEQIDSTKGWAHINYPSNCGEGDTTACCENTEVAAKCNAPCPSGNDSECYSGLPICGEGYNWSCVNNVCQNASICPCAGATATPQPTATIKPTATPKPGATATPQPGATATPTVPAATETPAPTITLPVGVTAQCTNVSVQKLVGGDWQNITDPTTEATIGDRLRFLVAGTATSGTFNSAAFYINNILHTSDVSKVNATTFTVEHILAVGELKVEAVMYHNSEGWVD